MRRGHGPGWWAVLGLALAVVAGCVNRTPPTRAEVLSAAESLQLRDGLNWGQPIEVLPPDPLASGKQSWWQLRYDDGGTGIPRIILVDPRTGWSRRPPDGYRPRAALASRPEDPAANDLVAGTWILLVNGDQPIPPEQRGQAELDVAELNRLASRTGLFPAFSLKTERDGSLRIVYGWRDDHGIPRDEAVRDWLGLRTRFRSSTWVELRVD